MKTILGLVHPFAGEVSFGGQRIDRLRPADVVRAGIAPVMERRRIFPDLTVYENLLMGAYTRTDSSAIREDIDKVYERFPVLRERRSQLGGTLSGGGTRRRSRSPRCSGTAAATASTSSRCSPSGSRHSQLT